ncbi:MAG: hypothetical protein JWO28_2492 [Hyphomicrobiales bacterium]|nr:hypothetical protein [Hyphomicrobiales bacterium]
MMNDRAPNDGLRGAAVHPVIIDGGATICVYLASANISGEGASVEEAYREFQVNYAAFEQRRKAYGLPAAGPGLFAPVRKPVLWQELSLFFTKTAIAAAAVIVVVVLLLPNIGAAVRHQVSAMVPAQLKDPAFWMVQFPAKVNGRFDRMEPAEAEQMEKDWAKLLERARPALQVLKCAP